MWHCICECNLLGPLGWLVDLDVFLNVSTAKRILGGRSQFHNSFVTDNCLYLAIKCVYFDSVYYISFKSKLPEYNK